MAGINNCYFRQRPTFFKFSLKSFSVFYETSTFVALRHTVTILVKDGTNPKNLTDDILIPSSLIKKLFVSR